MNKKRLKESFKEFLQIKDWTIWMTITFRTPKNALEAEKRFKHFFKYINTPNQQFFSNFIYAIVFYEKENLRNGVHIHALADRIKSDYSALLEKNCRKTFGESIVKPFHLGVSNYLCEKYTSSTLDHFDFYKINSRLREKITN